MKRVFNILLIIIICLTLVGCSKNESKKENKLKEEAKSNNSYLNCISKDDLTIGKMMFTYNESDEITELNLELEYNWGSIYGGGTDQVYEVAEKYVKEYFDSKFKSMNYTYDFFEEGNAIAKAKITKDQVESGKIKTLNGEDIAELFKMTKKEMKEHVYTYCTEDNSENWDIIIFDPLYEFIDIYLDYVNEDVKDYNDIKYSWYAVTKDLRVMNVVYFLDVEEGFTYAYSDYQVPTVDEELQRLKDGNTNGVSDPKKYTKWLENIKKTIEE